jgi:hypothetical protein
MPPTVLQLWEFEQAPANLRELIPMAYAGGWLMFVRPGGDAEVVQGFVDHCASTGVTLMKLSTTDGGFVLAGPLEKR